MGTIQIGILGLENPKDRKAFSGTPFKICQSLEEMGYKLKWIPVKKTRSYIFIGKIIGLLNHLRTKKINFSHTLLGATLQSKTVNSRLVENCDLIFTPFLSEALYCIKTNKPIVYLSDATYNLMVGYYYKNQANLSIKQGNIVEQHALNMSQAVIVSSDWAARSVVNDYHQPKEKVHVIEFGANIDDKDIIPHKFCYKGHLDILFLGVDWQRKGGGIAVDACRWLNENGVESTLHIVGIRNLDASISSLPFVDYIGFLDKNNSEQYSKLVSTIESCHCLLLPTKAECSAIAFSESSANGLPVFSHNTGGTSNYVYEGRNGYLLPLGSTGADFGRKIKHSLESGELSRMSEIAKQVYREKLNWSVWGKNVDEIIKKIVNDK